jgi:flagellar biosynthesis protein FlhB
MWCHDSNMYAVSTEHTCFMSLAFSCLILIYDYYWWNFLMVLLHAQLDSFTWEGNFESFGYLISLSKCIFMISNLIPPFSTMVVKGCTVCSWWAFLPYILSAMCWCSTDSQRYTIYSSTLNWLVAVLFWLIQKYLWWHISISFQTSIEYSPFSSVYYKNHSLCYAVSNRDYIFMLTIDVALLFCTAWSLIAVHGFLQCFDTEKLNLKKVDEYKYLKQSCCYSIAGVDDAQMFRTVTV